MKKTRFLYILFFIFTLAICSSCSTMSKQKAEESICETNSSTPSPLPDDNVSDSEYSEIPLSQVQSNSISGVGGDGVLSLDDYQAYSDWLKEYIDKPQDLQTLPFENPFIIYSDGILSFLEGYDEIIINWGADWLRTGMILRDAINFLGDPVRKKTEKNLMVYQIGPTYLFIYGETNVDGVAFIDENNSICSDLAALDKAIYERFISIYDISATLAELGSQSDIISDDRLWKAVVYNKSTVNKQILYIVDINGNYIRVDEERSMLGLVFLDNRSLLYSKNYDQHYIYDIATATSYRVEIIPEIGFYDTFSVDKIIQKGNNYIVFDSGNYRIKYFFEKSDGKYVFSNTDPTNEPGSFFNSLPDADCSNLNASNYAAADMNTLAYTYYSFGDLSHPQVIVQRFSDTGETGYDYSDPTENQAIPGLNEEQEAYFICFHGEKIYFLTQWYTYDAVPDKSWDEWEYHFYSALARINKDGSNGKIILEESVSYINSYGDQVYFLNSGGQICSVGNDDMIKIIYNGKCTFLYVDNNYAYYIEDDKLYRMNLSDGTYQSIIDTKIIKPSIVSSLVYYLDNDSKLAVYDMNTEIASIVLDKRILFYSIYSNGIYYNTVDEPGVINYLNRETSEERVIYKGRQVDSFILLGDYLFFVDSRDGYMSIRNDGSEFNVYSDFN